MIPGSARLALVDGVVHLDEESAVFDGDVGGAGRASRSSRLLGDGTINAQAVVIAPVQGVRRDVSVGVGSG